MHLTLVKRDGSWVLFEGNADTTVLDGRWLRKQRAVKKSKPYVDNGHYDELRIYKTNGKLQEKYTGPESIRRGDDVSTTGQLEPGDRMNPKPGANVNGRSLYGSKWKVIEADANGAVLRRMHGGRRGEERLHITSGDIGEFNIHTIDQSRAHWDDYESEGGHHIM